MGKDTRFKRRWDGEERERIISEMKKMRAEGASFVEIGKRFDTSATHANYLVNPRTKLVSKKPMTQKRALFTYVTETSKSVDKAMENYKNSMKDGDERMAHRWFDSGTRLRTQLFKDLQSVGYLDKAVDKKVKDVALDSMVTAIQQAREKINAKKGRIIELEQPG